MTPGRRVLQEVQTLEEHHNWSIDSNVALRSRQAEPQSLFIAYPANFLFLNVSSAGPACLPLRYLEGGDKEDPEVKYRQGNLVRPCCKIKSTTRAGTSEAEHCPAHAKVCFPFPAPLETKPQTNQTLTC